MIARKHERFIDQALVGSIGVNGARENDLFEIDIFQERKKTFKLNRTKYLIKAAKNFEFNFLKAEIHLPFFQKNAGDFSIELVPAISGLENYSEARYLIKSMSNQPFKLNGVHCFEAFIERGDIVDIGFNRFRFFKSTSSQSIEESRLSDEVINSKLSILIEGETGTGKTTLAYKIHKESKRSGSFVHLNLSAFSASLIESELFGHVKGAFTGALNSKKGAIVEAHKGTLFLDEIDSLSLDLQTKLLLFLDDQKVRAVGGDYFFQADVRLVFASGTKLDERVQNKEMRKDFFYRLQTGVVIKLDALRESRDLIKKHCLAFEEKEAVVISPELRDFYMTCPWPGNYRQLNSHLIKKKVLSRGKRLVQTEDDEVLLNDYSALKPLNISEYAPLENVKINYCYGLYLKTNKNISKTAKILEVSPNTLKAYLDKKAEELKIDLRDDNVIDINV